MKAIKKIVLGLCLFPVISHAGIGSESGGGGRSSERNLVTVEQLEKTLEIIHQTARNNFNFINVYLDDRTRPEIGNDDSIAVRDQIQKKLNQDPTFFKKLKLEIETYDGCEYADGKKSMATYSNGVICFDLKAIINMNYSEAEAQLKLTALYAHEVGHAAGYSNSINDERILDVYQRAVEALMKHWDFSFGSTGFSPLGTWDLGQRLEDLRNADSKKSRMWVCSKIQKIIDVIVDIPNSDKTDSPGYRFFSGVQESHLDLLTWEATVVAGLNCDGFDLIDKETIDRLLQSKKKEMSLVNALSDPRDLEQVPFCTYYPEVTCKYAKSKMIKTKPQTDDQFRKQAADLSGRILRFLTALTEAAK